MPCFHPLKGFRKPGGGWTPNPRIGYPDLPLSIACGQCSGCRLERSRQWAVRCYHESQLYDENCFITLTYNNEFLPEHGSLDVSHFQKFMKRLRFKYEHKIRFFHCGEYGEKNFRPHYHAILFNHHFRDKKLWEVRNEFPLYTSKELEALWPFGFSTVGECTFQSAAYVARYIMKKINGAMADAHYERICPDCGEIYKLKPEYVTMSRRPGIGQPWLKRFKTDVYPHDYVVANGAKSRPPRYYDLQLEVQDPDTLEKIKRTRVRKSVAHADNNTPERLKVREQCQHARMTFLKREL